MFLVHPTYYRQLWIITPYFFVMNNKCFIYQHVKFWVATNKVTLLTFSLDKRLIFSDHKICKISGVARSCRNSNRLCKTLRFILILFNDRKLTWHFLGNSAFECLMTRIQKWLLTTISNISRKQVPPHMLSLDSTVIFQDDKC